MKSKNPIFNKMVGLVFACCFTFTLLAGCVSLETPEQTVPPTLIPQAERAYHDILVVPPLAALEAAEAAGTLEQIEEMLQAAQEYFDTTMLDLSAPTFYFIPLRGEYSHANEEMELVGAIVNRHEDPIVSFSGRIRMQTDAADMQIATVTLDFPPEFIGELRPNEALLISLSVPVRGLNEDQIFEAFQLRAELSDIAVGVE
jgi:hypothetical protein